ncbi:hypothetical protein HDU99_005339 [Rhizoclosmatium hyalinum]|nr:hypothetical protein HDU99_005339 [Rhizoclosmatium hyalinum]
MCNNDWYCIRDLPAGSDHTMTNGTNPRDQYETVSILNALAIINGAVPISRGQTVSPTAPTGSTSGGTNVALYAGIGGGIAGLLLVGGLVYYCTRPAKPVDRNVPQYGLDEKPVSRDEVVANAAAARLPRNNTVSPQQPTVAPGQYGAYGQQQSQYAAGSVAVGAAAAGVYGQQQPYGQQQQQYAGYPPQQGYAPQQAYAPQQNYAPAQGYGAPQGFAPQQGYGVPAPPPSSTPQQPSYGQPVPQGYPQQPGGYGQPTPQAYTAPQRNYSQTSSQGYSPSAEGYAPAPQQQYAAAPQGYSSAAQQPPAQAASYNYAPRPRTGSPKSQ